ncbi:phage integrase N-terminal domain-containing protein [Pseudomonas aeruginosa]|uniref:phage integrase N-terminal domain-containing protein n=1 Tax=Pseudomonas aeruginosa TaxID=287 RepID=UPI002330FBD8|nr:phage integrase N-terminal domain-containing protein [Pseudomonas aeruginosa]
MDDLTYGLRQLCRRNKDGSHATQGDRLGGLTLVARQLGEAGFRRMSPNSLKGKHVAALVERWQAEGLSAGTVKNRLSHVRWWTEKVGKAGLIPADNTLLGGPQRQHVTNVDKSKTLGDALDGVRDAHVRISLQLQQAFGLRREESIKFQPRYADRGDHIALKGSWTKGGRERTVPITTTEQRQVLDLVHELIPAHKNFIQQRNTYDGQCKAAGLSNMHGLRHRYAQDRYEVLTGWKAAAGGPSARELTPAQRIMDAQARQAISRELGHERTQITAVYLGR